MQDRTGRTGAGQHATRTGETKPHRPVSLQGMSTSSYVQTILLNCVTIGLAESQWKGIPRRPGVRPAPHPPCCSVMDGTLHESFARLVVVSERRLLDLAGLRDI